MTTTKGINISLGWGEGGRGSLTQQVMTTIYQLEESKTISKDLLLII